MDALNARLGVLLRHLRRYRVGAIYAPPDARAHVVRAFRTAVPEGATIDLLDGLDSGSLDGLLARDVVDWTEARDCAMPALVLHAEAVWSPLAPRKLGDAWRALVLSETPPAPRVLLIHSPAFVDQLAAAFASSPEPERLVHWNS